MNDQNPNDQGQSGSGINPAWKPYLDSCPEVLKPQMIEIFKQWDAGVQQKLQSVRNEFAGADKYKEIIASGIDPTYINQAIGLAQQLQADPKAMAERIHQTFKLDYVPRDQQQQRQSNEFDDEFNQGNNGYSFANDPAYKQVMEALQQMQERETQREQYQQEQYSREQFENELDELEDKYKDGPFNRILVTAFMGTGLSGDEAVAAYRREIGTDLSAEQIINQQQTQQNNQQQPVFMGSGDGGGNGIPAAQAPNFGDMSKGDINQLVSDYIAKSQTPD